MADSGSGEMDPRARMVPEGGGSARKATQEDRERVAGRSRARGPRGEGGGLRLRRALARITAELRDFGAAYTAAWNSEQPDSVAAFFQEGGSLRVNEAEPAVGREAIAEVARGFMTAFPDLQLVMDSVRRTSDDTVAYHWTFLGTNTGPGGTGNAVRFSGYEEWSLGDDGLIARSLGHFDEAEYERQLRLGIDSVPKR